MPETPIDVRKSIWRNTLLTRLLPFGALTVPLARVWSAR